MNREHYVYRNGQFMGALFPDDDGFNPREEYENMGHMICWHNHYLLGDKDQRTSQSPTEWLQGLACEVQPGLKERLEFWDNDGYTRLYDIIKRNWRVNLTLSVEDVEEALLRAGFQVDVHGVCANLEVGLPDDSIDPRVQALERYVALLQPLRDAYYQEDWKDENYKRVKFTWQYNTVYQIARMELAEVLVSNRDYPIGHRAISKAAIAKINAKQRQLVKAALEDVIILELGLLDHNGLHIYVSGSAHWSDSAGWDSGTCGFIYLTKEEIIHEYGDFSPESKAKAIKYLEGEVETYDQYLTGDVWGYRAGKIPDELYAQLEAGEIDEDDIDFDDLEDKDACWGFYGQEYAEEEMHSVVDHMAKEAEAVVA